MKKLLGLLVASLIAFPASATVLKNVETKGEIQVIASDVKNDVNKIYNHGATARVLAGLKADLVEDVTANLMFQYANDWGNDAATGRIVQDYWDDVRLVEGNVVLHNLFCCLEATVGRQFYGDENSAVMYFGPNHYNAEYNGLARSLDAAKVTYGDDFKTFTVIAGRVNPSHTGINSANPYSMYGADLKLNLTDNLTAQVYGYDFRDVEDVDADKDFGFYGAKVALDGAVRVAGEYARNFGGHRLIKEHNDTGHMAKVDVAFDVDAFTVRGTGVYANENFWALGNYTPGMLVGHLTSGYGLMFNRYSVEGVTLFNVGVDFKPADKWTVSLDGYSFQDRRLKHAASYEADLTAKYAHNEYVELFAGVGYAKYTAWNGTNFNKATYAKDNVKGQLGMLIKF